MGNNKRDGLTGQHAQSIQPNTSTALDDDIFAQFIKLSSEALNLRHSPRMKSLERALDKAIGEESQAGIISHATPALQRLLQKDFTELGYAFWDVLVKKLGPAMSSQSPGLQDELRLWARAQFKPQQFCAVLKMNVETYQHFLTDYNPVDMQQGDNDRDDAYLMLAQMRYILYPQLVSLLASQSGRPEDDIDAEVDATIARWHAGDAPELVGSEWIRRPAATGFLSNNLILHK